MSELSKKLNIPERSLYYQFSNGSIPFVLVNRVAKALDLSLDELVGQGLASDWEEAYDQTKGANKPRGKGRIATITGTQKKNSDRVPPAQEPPKKAAPQPVKDRVPPKKSPEPSLQIDVSGLADLVQEKPKMNDEDEDFIPKNIQISDDLFRTSMA